MAGQSMEFYHFVPKKRIIPLFLRHRKWFETMCESRFTQENDMGLVDELQRLEELYRNGTLNDDEFTLAKAKLLSGQNASSNAPVAQHLADQLSEVRYQNELARIDREWEIEKEQYMITGQYGRRRIPTEAMGIGTAVGGGIFGFLWLIMAVSMTSNAPDFGGFGVAKVIFPLFGVAFIIGAIGYGIHVYNKALKYNEAFAAFQARRAAVTPDQFR